MGFGDVVLLAMIGSFLGWQPAVLVFFFAPLCALVVVLGLVAASWCSRNRSPTREIPFGPYLSLATLIVLLAWPTIAAGAERFFSLGPLFLLLAAMLAGVLVAVLWLVQAVKWLLGIPLYEDDWLAAWTSADQLAFFASKEPAAQTRGMLPPEWPGAAAGRGTLHRDRWQRG
jgi:leader peptidase (prepilin peptidase)/N-methyltransferase